MGAFQNREKLRIYCIFSEVAIMGTLPNSYMGMNVKTISSKDAQNSFGAFLDSAQREAVVVTRRNRPVGVMLPMNNLSALLEFADSIRETIKAGVKAGLADSAAGRAHELTDEYIEALKHKAQQRIIANQVR